MANTAQLSHEPLSTEVVSDADLKKHLAKPERLTHPGRPTMRRGDSPPPPNKNVDLDDALPF
jgi:hypothetical protein